MTLSPNHAHCAVIKPLDDSNPRPKWSVMIPTYNCANYLRQTLASVLAQDPGPETMQIQVVDDHSTQDDPQSVVAELGQGRVEFYRQKQNVGHIRNFETCLHHSCGYLIHILHGDDYVLENFYQKLQQGFDNHPEVGAAFCRHNYINEDGQIQAASTLESSTGGVLNGWLEKIAAGQRIATPSIVVRRKVYEMLGAFDQRLALCGSEDWEMWVRIAAYYSIWFEPEILAAYRITRPGSITTSALTTFRLAQDMRQAVEIIESYLPNHMPRSKAKQALGSARRLYATWALEGATDLLSSQNWQATSGQIEEALRCSHHPSILWAVTKLRWKVWMKKMQQCSSWPQQFLEGHRD